MYCIVHTYYYCTILNLIYLGPFSLIYLYKEIALRHSQ